MTLDILDTVNFYRKDFYKNSLPEFFSSFFCNNDSPNETELQKFPNAVVSIPIRIVGSTVASTLLDSKGYIVGFVAYDTKRLTINGKALENILCSEYVGTMFIDYWEILKK